MSEEKEVTWEDYVRSEVNSLLDLYLPHVDTGNVGIKYDHPAINFDEGGNPVDLDRTRISGVTVQLVFPFVEPMDIIKDEE